MSDKERAFYLTLAAATLELAAPRLSEQAVASLRAVLERDGQAHSQTT